MAVRGSWLLMAAALLAGCEATSTGTAPPNGSSAAGPSAQTAADAARLNRDLARFGISMTMPEWSTPAEMSRLSGLPAANVVSVGTTDGKQVIFFRPAGLPPAVIAAAPAKVCAAGGGRVRSSVVEPLVHPDQLPGVMKLVVECR